MSASTSTHDPYANSDEYPDDPLFYEQKGDDYDAPNPYDPKYDDAGDAEGEPMNFMADEMYDDDGVMIDPVPSSFNPNRYLTKVSGQDYLEVKWRLLWLRTDHPNASIDTTCLTYDNQHASFKASISIPGRGAASGHGSETPGDFRDYYEKAETKALGRALAALGFGTQFSKDYDFSAGSSEQRVVDSPVRTQQAPQGQMFTPSNPPRTVPAGPPVATFRGPATPPQMPQKPDNYNGPSEKQIAWILGLEKNFEEGELQYHYQLNEIDRMNLTGGRGGTASLTIDLLNKLKGEKQQGG